MVDQLPLNKDFAQDGTLIIDGGSPKDPPPRELNSPGEPPTSVVNYQVHDTDGASKPTTDKKGVYDKIIEAAPVLNPYNWGVEDFSFHKEFSSAYKAARTKGVKEFMWNNKRYNTQNSGTPTQQYNMYDNVNSQVDSEVSDKTATRIIQNSLTRNGTIDPELLERNFTINTLAGSPEYEHTTPSPLQARQYNKYLSSKNLPNITYTAKDQNTFRNENSKRSMYNLITENIIGHDYIDEEAHGYQSTQYKENAIMTMAKYWLHNPFFTEEQQYKIYDDPNSYEYDAHTIVQPVLQAYQNGDISKDEIPMYIKNMQQHKEEAFLWAPYVFGDRNYQVAKVQDALLKMGAFLEDEYGMIGKRTLRALSQYQTAITNNQPVQFTYFNKNELLNMDYKTASEIDQILIGKDLDTYGFGHNTPGAEGFSKESIQKRLEMFKKLYSAQPQTTEELSPVQPNYNRTPTKYGKGRKNVNRNTKTTSEYKGFNNSLE